MRTVVYTTQWYQAECDPDEIVKFQLKPLTNSMQSDIIGNIPTKRKRGKLDIDGGYIATMLVRCSLVGVEGLKDSRTADKDDPENEDKMKDLVLEFAKEKIGMRRVTVLKDEFIDLLPPDLYAEILDIVRGNVDLDDDEEDEDGEIKTTEQDELDFTSSSASEPTNSSAATSTATTETT